MDTSNIFFSLPEEANLQLPDPSLLQWYKDIENRVYWIDEQISTSTFDLIQYIIQWNRQDRVLPVTGRKPIKIFFNSPGGELDAAESLVSIIQLSKTPVYGYAISMVASAASLIFLACHKRFALPNAYFIFHKGSYASNGANYNELMAAMDDYKKQVEQMVQFYISHTGYEESEVRAKIETDWYIRGQELVDRKIVDEFIIDINSLL